MADPIHPKSSNGNGATSKIVREAFKRLNESVEATWEAPGGQVVPSSESMRALARHSSIQSALESQGVTVDLIAERLKLLLSPTVPKWNKAEGDWDHFIDGPLLLATINRLCKILGIDAPTKQINLNIDMDLQEVLRSKASPDSIQSQVSDYLQSFGPTKYEYPNAELGNPGTSREED